MRIALYVQYVLQVAYYVDVVCFRTTETKNEYSQTALSISELLFTSPPMTAAGDAQTTTSTRVLLKTQTTRVVVMRTWEAYFN